MNARWTWSRLSGIKLLAAKILNRLDRAGPATKSQLGQTLRVPKSEMTGAFAFLSASNLVSFERVNPTHDWPCMVGRASYRVHLIEVPRWAWSDQAVQAAKPKRKKRPASAWFLEHLEIWKREREECRAPADTSSTGDLVRFPGMTRAQCGFPIRLPRRKS
jgi:hypothetical protein